MEGNKDQLAKNREAALKHLEITEGNLANKDFVKQEHQSTLNAYLGKGCLGKLSPEEKHSPESWHVPHFPIVRIDKTTTKVRIVFDCLARHSGVSLINVIHAAGPKMKSELFDNRRCISVQIKIEEKDRLFFRFLRRNSETDREPDEY